MNIELVASRQQANYELVYRDQKLQLNWLGGEKFLPIYAQAPKIQRLTSTNLLYKAIGKHTRSVHDLTAGLGMDAMTMAAFGKKVYCIERCAPVALLLFDGAGRTSARIAAKLEINFEDSIQWLKSPTAQIETVYMDTMFAYKKKTAKSPKSMQILRALAGDDNDAQELFNLTLNSGAKRIVVKHTDNAPVLKQKPTAQYQGKTIRFDVYMIN